MKNVQSKCILKFFYSKSGKKYYNFCNNFKISITLTINFIVNIFLENKKKNKILIRYWLQDIMDRTVYDDFYRVFFIVYSAFYIQPLKSLSNVKLVKRGIEYIFPNSFVIHKKNLVAFCLI